MRAGGVVAILVGTILLAACSAVAQPFDDPEKGTLDGSPLDDLPPHIRLLTSFGMRPDWSPDGKRLVFLDGSPVGDVWLASAASGKARKLTGRFPHRGFTRACFLANGDLLLCGPTSGPAPSPDRPEAGRFTGMLSVLRATRGFRGPPQPLGIPCWEGVAASRDTPEIAWNRSDIDYTASNLVERVVFGISEIWTGRIRFRDGHAVVTEVRMAADRTAVSPIAVLEVQGFRGRRELILTAYAHAGAEVLGLDRRTGAVRNYSQSPVYEEAEGVAPSGEWVLVERDLESTFSPGPLDIWRLSLDGRSTWERLTHFNRYRGGWYASNPTVSPDARRFAFQLSIDGATEGQGAGILLFDLRRYEAARATAE